MKTPFLTFNLIIVGLVSSLISIFSGSAIAAEKINKKSVTVALYSSPTIRLAFLPLFKQFEEQTNIRVKTVRYTDQHEFHNSMDKWLVKGIDTPDILHGQSAERLYALAKKGLLHPQTQLWHRQGWFEKFRTELIDWVSYEGEVYGLPYGYYTWGLFYKKSLVEKFGPVPTTWDDFLYYCQQLKEAGISPFPASKKQPFIAAAWFEYLVLRSYGLSFFEEISAGKVSFHHPKVQSVLSQWQQMIELGFFDTQYEQYDWEEYIPRFLRDQIGFVFMSTNVGSRIYDKKFIEAVDFMPFPKINDIPRYESGPANSFFIAQNSQNKKAAEQFLDFFSLPEIQSQLGKYLYLSPAHNEAQSIGGKYTSAGHNTLLSAEGISPFFDRAAKPEFEKPAVKAFAEFLATGNTKMLTKQLEAIRVKGKGKLALNN